MIRLLYRFDNETLRDTLCNAAPAKGDEVLINGVVYVVMKERWFPLGEDDPGFPRTDVFVFLVLP